MNKVVTFYLYWLMLIFFFITPKLAFAGGVPEDNRDGWFFETTPANANFNSTWNNGKSPYGYKPAPNTYTLGETVKFKVLLRNGVDYQRTTRGFFGWFQIPPQNCANSDNRTYNGGTDFPYLQPGVDELTLFYDGRGGNQQYNDGRINDPNTNNRDCQKYGSRAVTGVQDWVFGDYEAKELEFTFTPQEVGYYQFDAAIGPWCHSSWSDITNNPTAPSSGVDCSVANSEHVAGFIRVVRPNNAKCLDISISNQFPITGSIFTATVRMKNTGTTTWTSANSYHLGSQNPQDNQTWGLNRAYLTSGPVSPGSTGVFTFNATAPNNIGTYNFDWKMIQDGSEWFGDLCTTTVAPAQEQLITKPISASCTLSKNVVNINEQLDWIASPTGGNGNYLYYWFGDVSGSSRLITTSYSSPGNKSGKLIVKSGNRVFPIGSDVNTGSGALDCGSVTVNQSILTIPLSLSCSSPQPASGQVETQFILSSTASEGSGNYIYYWNIQEPNRYPKLLGGTSSSSSIPWTPTTAGTTNASATVYSGSQSASCSVDFNVSGHLPSSFNPGTVTNYCAGANNPRMDVTWSASKYARSYKIDRWTLINGNIAFEKTIDTIPANSYLQFLAENNNSFAYNYWYTDSKPPLSPNTYYFYHITAINDYDSKDAWVVGSNGISCPAPFVYLKVNESDGPVTLNEGATPTVTWTAQNTYSCYVNTSNLNVWPGYHYYSGEKTEPLLSSRSPVTFFIQCSGITAGTYANDQVTVNVTPPPPPPPPTPPPPSLLLVSCQPDPSQILIGGFTDWVARVSGAVEPYDVTFPEGELKGQKAKKVFDVDGKLTFQGRATYLTGGTYSQDVLVKSKDGQSKQITCSPSVTAANNPPVGFFFSTALPSCQGQKQNKPVVNLNWTKSDYALSYWVGRTDEDGGSNYVPYKPIYDLNFTDTDVVPSKTYIYFVFSENPYGMNTGILADPSRKPSWDPSSPEYTFLQQITTLACQTPPSPTVSCTAFPTTANIGQQITFIATSQNLAPGQAIDWTGFEDGHGHTGATVINDHTFSSSGVKAVAIRVRDRGGQGNVITRDDCPVTINPVSPASSSSPPSSTSPSSAPASSTPPYIQTEGGDVHSNIKIKGNQ